MKLLIIIGMLILSSVAFSQPEKLLQSSTSWDGGAIKYPEGTPEITTVKLILEPGQDVPFHCHPVPTFGYIAKGDLEVTTKEGKKTILKEGTSVIEVMRTVHKGRAVNGTVEVIVFYAGAKGIPTTVLPENDPDHQFCS